MTSKLIRRTHMYLGLFLAPWLLMYAASTFAMNHRAWFRSNAAFTAEREDVYRGQEPAQLLRDLGIEGAHNVNTSPDGQRVTILRHDLVAPRRVVVTRADNRVVVEKQVFKMPAFLERFHRRRGYQFSYALDDSWAFSVDLAIAALVFWSLSGLWLWWEL